MTENGYIRRFILKGETQQLVILASALHDESYRLDLQKGELHAPVSCLDLPGAEQFDWLLEYHVSQIFPQPTALNDYLAVPLNDLKDVYIERRPAWITLPINPDEKHRIRAFFRNHTSLEPDNERLERLLYYEQIPEGLGDIY